MGGKIEAASYGLCQTAAIDWNAETFFVFFVGSTCKDCLRSD